MTSSLRHFSFRFAKRVQQMASSLRSNWRNDTVVEPIAFSGTYAILIGGTAQILFSSGEVDNGAIIFNPQTAAQQNIATAESIWYDITGAIAVMHAGGTSVELFPGQTLPVPRGIVTALSWIAATTGHRISGYKW